MLRNGLRRSRFSAAGRRGRQCAQSFPVSTTINKWPGLPSGTLIEPEIAIPLTMADVRKGTDPVQVWFGASAPSSGGSGD